MQYIKIILIGKNNNKIYQEIMIVLAIIIIISVEVSYIKI